MCTSTICKVLNLSSAWRGVSPPANVLAYCLQVTLKARLRTLAGGLTPRQVLDKFKTLQMVDVHIPTTDGRELVLSRYTQPELEQIGRAHV